MKKLANKKLMRIGEAEWVERRGLTERKWFSGNMIKTQSLNGMFTLSEYARGGGNLTLPFDSM